MRPGRKGKDKRLWRYEDGVSLGTRIESNELLVGTPLGVSVVRFMARKGAHSERWNLTQCNEVRGPHGNLSHAGTTRERGLLGHPQCSIMTKQEEK